MLTMSFFFSLDEMGKFVIELLEKEDSNGSVVTLTADKGSQILYTEEDSYK